MTPRMYDCIKISSADVYRTAAQLAVFGFEIDPTARTSGLVLREIGNGPRIELDAETHPFEERAVFFGIDIYTSNAKLTGDVAAAGRWTTSVPNTYWAWGRPIIETHMRAEDGHLAVLAAQTDPALALPSRLDLCPEELHSGVKTAVWFIEERSVSREIEFWTRTMGYQLLEEPTWYDADLMDLLFGTKDRRIGGVLFVAPDRLHTLECLYLEGGGLVYPGSGSQSASWHSVVFNDQDSISPDNPSGASLLRVLDRDHDFEEQYESPAGIRFDIRRNKQVA